MYARNVLVLDNHHTEHLTLGELVLPFGVMFDY